MKFRAGGTHKVLTRVGQLDRDFTSSHELGHVLVLVHDLEGSVVEMVDNEAHVRVQAQINVHLWTNLEKKKTFKWRKRAISFYQGWFEAAVLEDISDFGETGARHDLRVHSDTIRERLVDRSLHRLHLSLGDGGQDVLIKQVNYNDNYSF